MYYLTNSTKSLAFITIITTLSTTCSLAANVVLNFEGIGDLASIQDYYNGGADDYGNSGKTYGVTFSKTAHGIIDLDTNPDFHGNFANEPSGSTALIFREGGMAVMNVTQGFKSTFSLFYSASAPVTIRIFGGLDGTGKQLATLTSVSNFTDNNCVGDIFGNYCNWDPMELNFPGVAKSVIFGGLPEFAYFDDIKFAPASAPATNQIPIPSAFWLLGSALIGLFKIKRKNLAVSR